MRTRSAKARAGSHRPATLRHPSHRSSTVAATGDTPPREHQRSNTSTSSTRSALQDLDQDHYQEQQQLQDQGAGHVSGRRKVASIHRQNSSMDVVRQAATVSTPTRPSLRVVTRPTRSSRATAVSQEEEQTAATTTTMARTITMTLRTPRKRKVKQVFTPTAMTLTTPQVFRPKRNNAKTKQQHTPNAVVDLTQQLAQDTPTITTRRRSPRFHDPPAPVTTATLSSTAPMGTALASDRRSSRRSTSSSRDQKPVNESQKSSPATTAGQVAATPASSSTNEPIPAASTLPMHKKIENRVRNIVKHVRYETSFLEVYEAEGWRRSNTEKLKPKQEITAIRKKLQARKQEIRQQLIKLQQLFAHDMPTQDACEDTEDICCSRCGETETQEDNDILLCDCVGCNRAYHQKCQEPFVGTQDIPEGDKEWYCNLCLTTYQCLRSINFAFDTEYETVDEVFADLNEKDTVEVSDQKDEDVEFVKVVETLQNEQRIDEEDEEEEDEDFRIEDEEEEDEEEVARDTTSNDTDDDGEEDQDGVDQDEQDDDVVVSDDELQYLKQNGSIISTGSGRSMRSHTSSLPGEASRWQVGTKVARSVRRKAISGVIVGEGSEDRYGNQRWRVEYVDGKSKELTSRHLEDQRALAQEQEPKETVEIDDDDDKNADGDQEEATTKGNPLIVTGKRKRNHVDYRALNDQLFDGELEDDDEEADASYSEDDEEQDEDDDRQPAQVVIVDSDVDEEQNYQAQAVDASANDDDDAVVWIGSSKQPSSSTTHSTSSSSPLSSSSMVSRSTRSSKRQRKAVNYRAMHEGNSVTL